MSHGLASLNCPECGKSLKLQPELTGRKGRCPGCGHAMVIPAAATARGAGRAVGARSRSSPTQREVSPSVRRTKSSRGAGDSLFGATGLVLEIIFFLGIVAAPGRFETVMLGGILGLAGAVLSIIGVATTRGRTPGIIGLVLFLLAWLVNTLAIGRL